MLEFYIHGTLHGIQLEAKEKMISGDTLFSRIFPCIVFCESLLTSDSVISLSKQEKIVCPQRGVTELSDLTPLDITVK